MQKLEARGRNASVKNDEGQCSTNDEKIML